MERRQRGEKGERATKEGTMEFAGALFEHLVQSTRVLRACPPLLRIPWSFDRAATFQAFLGRVAVSNSRRSESKVGRREILSSKYHREGAEWCFFFFFFFLILPLYAFRTVGQAFGSGISVEREAPPSSSSPRAQRCPVWFGLEFVRAQRFFFFCFRTFEKRKKRRGERRKKNLFPLFVTVTGLKLLGINVPAYSLRGKSALLECR